MVHSMTLHTKDGRHLKVVTDAEQFDAAQRKAVEAAVALADNNSISLRKMVCGACL